MKHWNDHSIAKSGSSAECHTFSVNRGLVNTYLFTACLYQNVMNIPLSVLCLMSIMTALSIFQCCREMQNPCDKIIQMFYGLMWRYVTLNYQINRFFIFWVVLFFGRHALNVYPMDG
ncbi:hypothetical protein, partial [Vibrio sp.]|uniref:hypothetical protein n=1 Tax=Vibrio sp. TaxID=678 RepID=UPI0037B3E7B2